MPITIRIDEKRCIECGACAEACTQDIDLVTRGKISRGSTRPPRGTEDVDCLFCLHCYAVCPKQAVLVEKAGTLAEAQNGQPVTDGATAGAAEKQLVDLLASRRSIRHYEKKEVSIGTVERLLSYAGLIPSGGNRHGYSFIVLKNGEVRQKLKELIRKNYKVRGKILNSPILRYLLRPFVDKESRAYLKDDLYPGRIAHLVEQFAKGEDPIFYEAPIAICIHSRVSIPTPKEDAVLAAYNIVLIAETMGLGTCFVTQAQSSINSSRKAKELLGLEQEDTVHSVIILGYPDIDYLRPVPKVTRPAVWIE